MEKVIDPAPEVVALGDLLQALIADAIAKDYTKMIGDTLPKIGDVAKGFASLGADIALADNEAYLVRSLKLGINGK